MSKASSGWSMVGICSQWCIDNRLNNNELAVYLTIVRNSFGYKKRYCYMKYDSFNISNRNTLKKTIDSLVSKNIISCKNTFNPKTGNRGMNEYKIIEPRENIKNFVFDKKDTKYTNYIIEEDWDK